MEINAQIILAVGIYLVLAVVVLTLWRKIDRNFQNIQLVESGRAAQNSMCWMNDTLTATSSFTWYISPEQKVVINPQFFQKLGLRERKLSKESILHCLSDDDRVALRRACSDTSMSNTKLQLCFMLPDKTKHYIDLWINKMKEPDGKLSLMGMFIIVDDVKKLEEERREAFRLDEISSVKSSFLAAMGHEIRNPLNSIVGFSRLIVDSGRSLRQEALQKYCSVIEQNGENLLSLINNVIQYSQDRDADLQLALSKKRVSDLMDDLYTMHTALVPEGLDFKFVKGDASDYIMVNRSSLTQVVSNFMNNAITFTKKGSITLGWETGDSKVSIFVEDTGAGIEPENLHLVFDKYPKADPYAKGAGIGLSLCKKLVEKMSGSVSVTSEYGKGSRFSVELPRLTQ